MKSWTETVQKTDMHAETDNRVLHLALGHKAPAVPADDQMGVAAGALVDEALLEAADAALVKCQCAPGLDKHHTCHESSVLSQASHLVVGQELLTPSTVPLSPGAAQNSQLFC